MENVKLLVLSVGIIAAGGALMYLGFSHGAEPVGNPPVFLIITESIRSDHFGSCYEYERNTAPEVCEMAEEGVVYTEAYAPGTHTPMSLPSILTGLPPNSVGFSNWSQFSYRAKMPSQVVTVAEALEEEGYRTHTNIGANPFQWDGLSQGFQKEEVVSLNRNYSSREFYWFRIFEAHYPYTPPERNRKWDNVSMNRSELSQVSKQRERFNLSDQQMIDLYDAEIRTADGKIGKLIEYLKSQGKYRESLIIVTSDHGQSFGDRGNYYHGHKPYPEQSKVPLVVKYPGNRFSGERVERPVSLMGIVPTIYETAGIERETFTSPLREKSRYSVVSARKPDADWGAYTEKGYYLLRNVKSACLEDARPESESFNLSVSSSEMKEGLCNVYRQGEETSYDPEKAEMSDEMRQRLRDLGYID